MKIGGAMQLNKINSSIHGISQSFLEIFKNRPKANSFIFVVPSEDQKPMNVRISRDIIHLIQEKENGVKFEQKYMLKSGSFMNQESTDETRFQFIKKVKELYLDVLAPEGDGELFIEKKG
jgi:hypothetical protein